jgi:engulfment/cell motility protein 1
MLPPDPSLRACLLTRSSNETVELLLEFWEVSDSAISTHFQPLLLSFPFVHSLVLRFFLRMWDDSSATIDDFGRVCQVVKSQVELVLKEEEKAFGKAGAVERGFNEDVSYRVIRERMLKEVEEKDDLMGKPPIK